MKKDIKLKQMELLIETALHYNSNNRCRLNYECKYSPVTLGLQGKSEGCAIGRKVSPELAEKLDALGGTVKRRFNDLPDDLKSLGVDFLSKIQNLHDTKYFWEDKGINQFGKEFIKGICMLFQLDATLLPKELQII